jgi:hypothetical protein
MDNQKGASQNALNYAFSQYCGIFMASTFYFIAYCSKHPSSPCSAITPLINTHCQCTSATVRRCTPRSSCPPLSPASCGPLLRVSALDSLRLNPFFQRSCPAAWFIANQKLSQAVSYPIVTTLPGIIATLWGVLLFGEIRGQRNYLILGAAYAITFAGVTLTVLSQ